MPGAERCFCRGCSRCVIDVIYGAAAFLLVPVIYHTEKNYGILIAMGLWEKKEAMMGASWMQNRKKFLKY